jgi:exosortase
VLQSKTSFALFGCSLVLLLSLNWRVGLELIELARRDHTASHVIIVPLVAAALLFQSRSEIIRLSRPAWWSGGGLALFGQAMLLALDYLVVRGPSAVTLNGASLVLSCWGAFLFFYGWRAARAVTFPLMFLLFAIPLPSAVVDAVTETLKRGSTETVAALFSVTGTPFFRQGFVFTLPGFAIEVADECSGIRSSIALLLTSLLAGHTSLQSGWTKAFLVAAVIPFAILKNGIRIVSLCLLAMHVDPGFLVGQLHHEGGVVFFVLALMMLAPVLLILRRFERPISQTT